MSIGRRRDRTFPNWSTLLALSLAWSAAAPAAATEPGQPGYGCEVPSHDAIWRGRDDAHAWLPGFYPADDWPQRTVSLTFDDGPMAGRTEQILDLLAEHGYAATFFVVGRRIDESTWPILQRMVHEGHTIANHTWRHDTVMYLDRGEQFTVDYIAAEYGLTQVMVDLAMLASSSDDFAAMRAEVFGDVAYEPGRSELVAAWPDLAARHAALLARRNPGTSGSPLPLLYSRAPGGSPYFGSWPDSSRHYFALALERSGMLNVMWDGSSGDSSPSVDASLRENISYLTGNMLSAARQGGILLVHDRIPQAALVIAFDAFAEDGVQVRSLDDLTRERFGCAPVHLAAVQGVATPAVLLGSTGPAPMSADAAAGRVELDRVARERDAARADVATLEQTARALTGERDALQAALDTARADAVAARNAERNDLEAERDALLADLQRARIERDAARDALAGAEAAAAELAAMMPRLEAAELALSRRDDAPSAMGGDPSVLRAELESTRAELAAVSMRLRQAEAQLDSARQTRADATDDAVAETFRLQGELAAANEHIVEQTRELDARDEALRHAAREIAEREARLAQISEASERAGEDLERALDELAARDMALQRLRADLDAIDAERDALDEALREQAPTVALEYAPGPTFAGPGRDVPMCRAVGARDGDERMVPCPR